jgi:hypothetical protein
MAIVKLEKSSDSWLKKLRILNHGDPIKIICIADLDFSVCHLRPGIFFEWWRPVICGRSCELNIRHFYDTCNAMDNQRIIQSTPVIFSFKS